MTTVMMKTAMLQSVSLTLNATTIIQVLCVKDASLPFALAEFAVVFLIKLLDLTIFQGTINGLIFYANIVK